MPLTVAYTVQGRTWGLRLFRLALRCRSRRLIRFASRQVRLQYRFVGGRWHELAPGAFRHAVDDALDAS